jgi:DNA-binding NtrC family response regulator
VTPSANQTAAELRAEAARARRLAVGLDRDVIAHDDAEFVYNTAIALRAAGYSVAAFANSMSTLTALEDAQLVELLITRVLFPEGTPNGVALGRMARVKRPGVKVLFVGRPDTQAHTEGVGEFLPASVTASEIVEMVEKMLAA